VELFKTAATFGFGVIALSWASALILVIFEPEMDESFRKCIVRALVFLGIAIPVGLGVVCGWLIRKNSN
ncbi:MAG: hypothetical protein ACOC8H_01685, partial [bacterium]